MPSPQEPYFSHQAQQYAAFRPNYPESFLERLVSLAPSKDLAWDCGTGNGQCARQLKKHFTQVLATDISADQLSHGSELPGLSFRQAPAERCPLDDASVALTTVACAVHWFDRDRFYSEVKRVSYTGGIIAVWTYFMPQVEGPIDQLIQRYYLDLLAPYYSPQSELYRNKYQDLDFPFSEVKVEPASITEYWTGEQLLGFMGTWSARMTCLKQGAADPLEIVSQELPAIWGNLQTPKLVQIPLYARVGVVGK